MEPQHLATVWASVDGFEALPSHIRRLNDARYQCADKSPNLASREPEISLTSEPRRRGHIASCRFIPSHRRLRCPRASNSWRWLALLPPLQLAQAGRPKTSSWSLTQSPSRLSRYTQANSSNDLSGQACAPVPTPLILLHVEDE